MGDPRTKKGNSIGKKRLSLMVINVDVQLSKELVETSTSSKLQVSGE